MSTQKTAAIILAAGGSSRLGRPKQLLDWFGKPFVKQLIDLARESKLDPVIVVTGSGSNELEHVIRNDNVLIARNEHWQNGQSSSMQAGVNLIDREETTSFIIFLCDQPHVPIELLERMLIESQREGVDIVATSVNGKVCPPTLFKSICIDGILSLEGDQGGRGLFKSYRTEILNWEDDRLLQDSDTEEDYEKLKSLYTK